MARSDAMVRRTPAAHRPRAVLIANVATRALAPAALGALLALLAGRAHAQQNGERPDAAHEHVTTRRPATPVAPTAQVHDTAPPSATRQAPAAVRIGYESVGAGAGLIVAAAVGFVGAAITCSVVQIRFSLSPPGGPPDSCLFPLTGIFGLGVGLFTSPAFTSLGASWAGVRTSYFGSLLGALVLGGSAAAVATLAGEDWGAPVVTVPVTAALLAVGAVLGAELFRERPSSSAATSAATSRAHAPESDAR
jgi:hypothetical protein